MTLFLATLLTSPWLLATLATSPAITARCPEGWVDAHFADDMGCLLFNTSKTYNWELANNYCNIEVNASLVEIVTPEQHEYVIMELELLADNGHNHNWWTSGTDIGKQGRWYWTQSLALVEEFVWAVSEPNNPAYNCIYLSGGSDHFMAKDMSCAYGYYPICQTK